jgi:hypothetical protein
VHREIKKNLIAANVIRPFDVGGAASNDGTVCTPVLFDDFGRGAEIAEAPFAPVRARGERGRFEEAQSERDPSGRFLAIALSLAGCIQAWQIDRTRGAIRIRYGGRPQVVLPPPKCVNLFFTIGRSKKF